MPQMIHRSRVTEAAGGSSTPRPQLLPLHCWCCPAAPTPTPGGRHRQGERGGQVQVQDWRVPHHQGRPGAAREGRAACTSGLSPPCSNGSCRTRSLQPCPLTKSALPTHDCPLRCVPAPQIFRGDLNRPAPYEGPRDEPGIVKYLKKQVGWGGEVGCGGGEAGGMEDGRRAGGSHGDSLQAAAPQLCSV